MHALLFGLKRAYWGGVARSRKFLRKHWPHLTAARFDLMQAVQLYPYGPRQHQLQRELGVCRPVLTRMLKSLVELGWVTRKRCPSDRRTYDIQITAEGKKVFDSADYRIIRSRRAVRWVHEALIGLRDWSNKDLAFLRMGEIEYLLDLVRSGWNAGGTLHYAWHPDD